MTKTCSMRQCNKRARTFGMCADHYNEWYQDNVPNEKRAKRDPKTFSKRGGTITDRLDTHAVEENGHLIWHGAVDQYGRPVTTASARVPHTSVRASVWSLHNDGKLLERGKLAEALPSCPPRCVHPEHIRIVKSNQGSHHFRKDKSA